MKIAINNDHGGFSLSALIYDELGIKWDNYGYLSNKDFGIQSDNSYAYRADPRLIAAIEKVGEDKASGPYASIAIIDIPDNVDWIIEEYDGVEKIREKHRVWM